MTYATRSMVVAVGTWLLAQQPQPQPARPEPMLLPQVVVLPRGARELTIDGSLGDWPELPAVRIDDRRQLSGTANNAWQGPNDLGAVAFLLWDETDLFVGCAVKDEWHRALDPATLNLIEIPAADSLVLTFDPDRDTRAAGPDPGRREDREFWLADEAGRQVVQWDRLRGSARLLDTGVARAVVLHDKEHGITTYEARIPWNEILPPGRRAAAGLVVDLQLVVNDFDEATDPMPQTRVGLTFGCSPVVDPGLLASMMLVADAGALQGVVPEFPPKPGVAKPPAPPAEYWQQLTARLLQAPPVVYAGGGAPQDCGGTRRLQVLEEIDGHCERLPRIDHLELHQRIHRRMSREVAGIAARGLPSWWRQRLDGVSKNAEDPVPEGAVRVFRLPMGGWLVRGARRSFVVDPAGADVDKLLWGGSEFCVLTEPLQLSRRNDQLLVRMFLAEPPRPVFTHIAFHLPVVAMDTMPLIEPGGRHGPPDGVVVQALGRKTADGSVTWSCSYCVELPDGPRLLLVGQDLRADEVEAGRFDLAIVSPRNPALIDIVRKTAPALVLIDGVFECEVHPTTPRLPLRALHVLQQALLPAPSLLLAPGESWQVQARAR